jgi:hypothetical protein
MVALAVSAIIMVGSMQILSHMVVTTAQNRASTMAMLQVQYVGFWVTEDVVQARPDDVCIGGTEGCPPDFLTIQWTQWNGVKHKVVYSYSVEGDETWKLYRQEWYTPKGGSEILNGTVVVGESLDPAGTRCEWVTGGNVTDVLKLDVTAVGDTYATDPAKRHEATRTYEINPRSK